MFSNLLIQSRLKFILASSAVGVAIAFSSSAVAQPSPPKQIAQTKSLAQKNCPIERSSYTAIGNPKFELVFVPLIKPAIASELVSFSLKHKIRGTIVTYNMGGTNGYSSLYLRDSATSIEDDRGSEFKPVFFDANWNHADLPLQTAPKYLFISGLGSSDYYAERSGNRKMPLGEVMWQLSSCRR